MVCIIQAVTFTQKKAEKAEETVNTYNIICFLRFKKAELISVYYLVSGVAGLSKFSTSFFLMKGLAIPKNAINARAKTASVIPAICTIVSMMIEN